MPTHYRGSAIESLALDAFIKFSRANAAFEARLLGRRTLGDLTLTQFAVLEALYHLGSLCQGELSHKVLKSTGNMTLVLDNLERHKLVRRVRSLDDRRMIRIELTPAGKACIEEVLPQHVAAIVEEISVLSPQEQAELGRLSKKLGLGWLIKADEPVEVEETSPRGE